MHKAAYGRTNQLPQCITVLQQHFNCTLPFKNTGILTSCLTEKNLCACMMCTCVCIIYQSVLAVQIKNWEPLVFGPELAMLKMPFPVCFNEKFSSLNFSP